MNISYKVRYINTDNDDVIVNIYNIEEAKQLYKTLLDNNYKNIKFFIVNKQETELSYNELFEK